MVDVVMGPPSEWVESGHKSYAGSYVQACGVHMCELTSLELFICNHEVYYRYSYIHTIICILCTKINIQKR